MSNICIFSRAFYPAVGGLERMAQLLATQFANVGHSVEVVTDTLGTSVVDDEQFQFMITRTSKYSDRVNAFKRADVVLSMNISLHGFVAAWRAGVHVIATHQGCYEINNLRSFFLENLKRFSMRFISNISCSTYVANQFREPSTIIPNSYDSVQFVAPSQRSSIYDFVFCGRLVSDKGADVCVRAFACVAESVSDITLTIIGDGPELLPLQKLTNDLGVTELVRFTGVLRGKHLVSELQKHACMVVPSLWEEPFGIVALEGIACCESVIVSRRGGLPEAAGFCGIVVEPTVAELVTAMLAVVQARKSGDLLPGQPVPSVRSAHLERHTPQVVAKMYLDVIESVAVLKAR